MQPFRHDLLPNTQRFKKGVLAMACVLAMIMVFMVPPENVPSCTFHSLTGHSCLTCGMSRSLYAVSHGDIAGSFRFHLFGPMLFVGLALVSLVLGLESVSGKFVTLKIPRGYRKILLVFVLAVWLVYWAGRFMTELLA